MPKILGSRRSTEEKPAAMSNDAKNPLSWCAESASCSEPRSKAMGIPTGAIASHPLLDRQPATAPS